MKKKKKILFFAAVISCLPLIFLFFLVIIVSASGGSVSGYEALETNISLYSDVIEEVYEAKEYRLDMNEISWFYTLSGIKPSYEQLKAEAMWIADNNPDSKELAEYYKNNSHYREYLDEYTADELASFIEKNEKINSSFIGTNDEIIVGEGDERGKMIVEKALTRLGCMYKWGAGHSENEVRNSNLKRFDCSGLVNWSLYHCGYSYPLMTTQTMIDAGKKVTKGSLSAGDIILFSSDGTDEGVHHVGIYIGENRMVHAPRTGKPVMISSIESGYYSEQYYMARRLY